MIDYGLIGQRLSHSFSKLIHEELCNYSYELCPLPTEKSFSDFMQRRAFKAINVTIPYKEMVIPFCAAIDNHAREIGAVNTIINENGILKGYNTDFAGLSYMISKAGANVCDKVVLILGTGGTSKTAAAVCKAMSAREIIIASRTPREGIISYAQALECQNVQIIINTSPVGMYPDTCNAPIDISCFPALYAVLDVVYNPLETRIVSAARERGLIAANGLSMLVAQAVYAARLFTNSDIPRSEIDRVLAWLYAKQASLVLVGMPSCGKTSLGKAVAKLLQKPFVDIDELIERKANMPISQIFADKGEEHFRELEASAIKTECAVGGKIISTGGGAVLRRDNVLNMRQNGAVIHIKRPLEHLEIGGARPLSQSPEALREMSVRREPYYKTAAHKSIDNSIAFDDAAQLLMEAFYEAINN